MSQTQRIHLIALGGSIMHSLAISLKQAGHQVTGSDDHIYEPSKSNLDKQGLLPANEGWNPDIINDTIDLVILGMHAKADNPELIKAKALNIKIYSYPEYIFECSKDKQRIVIAGSHGKTSITAMVMHVLKSIGRDFDYMVGAQLSGFENMVKLSDAPIIIIEGDEYTTSSSDSRPKFLNYHHHIGAISGISWDHYNVYPTQADYIGLFKQFADATPKAGSLIYCEEDTLVNNIVNEKERNDVFNLPYKAHEHIVKNGKTFLVFPEGELQMEVFGYHNMQNVSCAKAILHRIGVLDEDFNNHIVTFKGAAKRMEIVGQNSETIIYTDFAHAPSKLLATTLALKDQFPDRQMVACLELHTFSSLNKAFINQYEGTFNNSDQAIIYIDPKAASQKGLEQLTENDLRTAFKRNDILLFNDKNQLEEYLHNQNWKSKNLILMSSGNFGGLDFKTLQERILD